MGAAGRAVRAPQRTSAARRRFHGRPPRALPWSRPPHTFHLPAAHLRHHSQVEHVTVGVGGLVAVACIARGLAGCGQRVPVQRRVHTRSRARQPNPAGWQARPAVTCTAHAQAAACTQGGPKARQPLDKAAGAGRAQLFFHTSTPGSDPRRPDPHSAHQWWPSWSR